MGSAAVIGGTGALLGVLAGLAPGIAVAYPLTSTDYGSGGAPVVVVPWDLLAAVAVGVPLLAVVVTGLAVRSRLPMTARLDA
jgi:putative ABC transport system permease protein